MGLLCLCMALQAPSTASSYRGGWLLMPQARGSSAVVWAQSGICVARNMSCLRIPEHWSSVPG